MSGFDSPAFRKKFAENQAQQNKLREFTVGDPTADLEDDPFIQRELSQDEIEQLKRARQQAIAASEKITDSAKKRIEILANIGRLTKDVKLDNYLFSLRTLKGKETRDATLASIQGTQAEASFEIRRQMLARSIFMIDGKDIELVLGNNSLEKRLEFVDDLEDVVISKLYDEYESLRSDAKKRYSITTEQEAQEVVEDLKK